MISIEMAKWLGNFEVRGDPMTGREYLHGDNNDGFNHRMATRVELPQRVGRRWVIDSIKYRECVNSIVLVSKETL